VPRISIQSPIEASAKPSQAPGPGRTEAAFASRNSFGADLAGQTYALDLAKR
jgi:hypothetical protein